MARFSVVKGWHGALGRALEKAGVGEKKIRTLKRKVFRALQKAERTRVYKQMGDRTRKQREKRNRQIQTFVAKRLREWDESLSAAKAQKLARSSSAFTRAKKLKSSRDLDREYVQVDVRGKPLRGRGRRGGKKYYRLSIVKKIRGPGHRTRRVPVGRVISAATVNRRMGSGRYWKNIKALRGALGAGATTADARRFYKTLLSSPESIRRSKYYEALREAGIEVKRAGRKPVGRTGHRNAERKGRAARRRPAGQGDKRRTRRVR